MLHLNNHDNARENTVSAFAVLLIHAAFGYLLVTGFGVDVVQSIQRSLTIVNVETLPIASPPPIETVIQKSEEQQGKASAKNLKAKATPVIAPKTRIKLPTKQEIIAAEIPRQGRDNNAGASDERGPGAGSGGQGDGTGAGGRGNGGGGLIVASRAQLISGRINNKDYPRTAAKIRAGGTVIAFYTVKTDGRVTDCKIKRSSGHPDLDATTCRLIQERFRYKPARDSNGNAIADVTGWQQKWWLGQNEPD